MRVVVVLLLLLVSGENKVNSYSDQLNLDLVCKFGVEFDKKSLFLVFLEIGNNEVTDLHAHFFLLNPNHLLVAHQQLGFVVLQFSLKVHHLLLGISQVHFGITQDKIMS